MNIEVDVHEIFNELSGYEKERLAQMLIDDGYGNDEDVSSLTGDGYHSDFGYELKEKLDDMGFRHRVGGSFQTTEDALAELYSWVPNVEL